MLAWFLAISAALSSTAIAADPTVELPTKKWVVDFDDEQCLAMRDYGTATRPTKLVFKPSPFGKQMRIAVVRPGVHPTPSQVWASVTFDSARPLTASMLIYSGANSGGVVMRALNLPMETMAIFRTAREIRIEGGSFDTRFGLSQAGAILDLLDTCLKDLQDVWNIGSGYASRIKQGPRSHKPLFEWFDSADYPDSAASEDQEGVTRFTALIDEQGKVRDCTIDTTSGAAKLDAQVCHVLQTRVRFSPAIGHDGKPMKSAISQNVNWTLSG